MKYFPIDQYVHIGGGGGIKLGHPKARVYHFSGDYTE